MTTTGRARRWTIAVTAMALGVLGVGAIMPVHAAEGDVEYLLAWDTTGVVWGSDGSWTTTTDLGYSVTVHEGSLTTFSATLVACEHDHGLFGWLFGLVGPAVAEAGHASDLDTALVGGPVVEDLTDPSTVVLGTATVDEPAYCEGHTAWGTVDAAAPTLTLSGSWSSPAGVTGDFDLASTVDWGVAGSLGDQSGDVHVEVGEPASIQITRTLATAFDGIELVDADDETLAMGVLRALAGSTEFLVVSGVAHG